ncbi:hypothetical protein GCM10007907_24720 [Chitinimonas prasina]|uniref:Integrase catalytic domain-containing protein n=2 Tax=Chitinimonas prasina TaxID=1434937 RepID=A0ABQ5YFA9_9NEIS|nr:hypothetical protein GCM10007907_24720 [Chitinimonas prasina]
MVRDDGLAPLLSLLPEAHQAEVRRKLRYVNQVLADCLYVSAAREITQVIAQVAERWADAAAPSVTTIWRWVRAYLDSGKDPLSLAPRHACKGNRQRRFPPELWDLFLQAVDEAFLKPERPTRLQAYDHFEALMLAWNRANPQNRLKLCSYAAFGDWIANQLDPYVVMARRYGVAKARRHFRRHDAAPASTYPLERVEIDHTVLDLQAVDSTGNVIGRPTLTIAICRFSRMILAVLVTFESPAASLTLRCVREMLSDKSHLLLASKLLEGVEWPASGLPTWLVVDNGPDFHATAFKAACDNLTVQLQYCPPGLPWFKGVVERFFRTLNVGLIHRLPGTTRSNPTDRGAYPSEERALLKLDEIRTKIHEWLFLEYRHRRHSELGCSPQQAWDAGVAEHPIVPASTVTNQMEAALALVKHLSISGSMLRTCGLTYTADCLPYLKERVGASKVEVRIDPEDVQRAFVFDPDKKVLVALRLLTAIAPDTSFAVYQLQRKTIRRDLPLSQRLSDRAYVEGVHQLNQEIQELQDTASRQQKQKKSKSPKAPKPQKGSLCAGATRKQREVITGGDNKPAWSRRQTPNIVPQGDLRDGGWSTGTL